MALAGAGTSSHDDGTEQRVPSDRDALVDIVRAGSLGVVVLWHWVFTAIVWHSAGSAPGPHATNPIGTTRGLWAATWVLQVLPLFFVVGGAVHALQLAADPDAVRFWRRRAGRLIPPAVALVAVVAALVVAGTRIAHAFGAELPWLLRAAILVLSPLWFLVVYLALVGIAPFAWRAHQRFGELVPVWLAVAAAVADVARFIHHVPYVEWLQWILVWGFCHQLGFFWPRLRAAAPRFGSVLATAGVGALIALTNMRHYPRSMVGVPGEDFSNMGPPTLPIIALCVTQVGLLLRYGDQVAEWLRQHAGRGVTWLQENAMRLYVWHGPAFALFYGIVLVAVGHPGGDTDSAGWWLARPIWFVGPAVVFTSLVGLPARLVRRSSRRAAVSGVTGR